LHTKNPNLCIFLERLGMKNIGLCCGHLAYFVAIWYIVWPFGIFCGHFGMLYQEETGNPAG
jgi:hypothetical protein